MIKPKFITILRNLNRNWDGLSYDVMQDMVDVLRKNKEHESASYFEQHMIEIVGKNLFNHEQTYLDLWDLCNEMLKNGNAVVTYTLFQTLENLDAKGLSGKAELN